MLTLFTAGVMLVCFAQPIGEFLVFASPRETEHSPPQDVEAYTVAFRSLGFMLFAAGLVERVVFAIERLKS
jgi:hypothetical protein